MFGKFPTKIFKSISDQMILPKTSTKRKLVNYPKFFQELQCSKKQTVQDLLYEGKQVYFETRLHTLKVLLCCFLSNVQRDMAWGFQMSYYSLPQIKGLDSCDLTKLEVQKRRVNPLPLESGESNLLDEISLESKMSDFFQTSNLDRSQFCSPLTYDGAQ